MQSKAASLVALAVWFSGAVKASALSPRVGPVADAAVAHVVIHPILDQSLCATATGFGQGSPIVLSACSNPPTAAQIWAVNTLDNARIVQFQNADTNRCLAIVNDPFNGEPVTNADCLNSDGSGRPVSNTEFDTSPQTITANNLPIAVTSLNNRIHFSNSGFCMDRSGNNVVVNSCSGAIGQTWIMGPSGTL